MARILALDYGKKRIGLAISDPLGVAAHSLETFQRTRVRDDLAKLTAIAQERGAEVLLFGDPLNMDGSRGPASHAVHEFARRLEKLSGIPVVFWDERLTSFEANEMLAEQGVPFEKRRELVDCAAAVVLLRSYLEAQAA